MNFAELTKALGDYVVGPLLIRPLRLTHIGFAAVALLSVMLSPYSALFSQNVPSPREQEARPDKQIPTQNERSEIEQLIQTFRSGLYEKYLTAEDRLVHIGPPALYQLGDALMDDSSTVRLYAASTIAKIVSSQKDAMTKKMPYDLLKPHLIYALTAQSSSGYDGGAAARQAASDALVSIGSSGVPPLIRALKKTHTRNKDDIVRTLGRLANLYKERSQRKIAFEEAVPILIDMVHSDPFSNPSAILALGAIGDSAAVPVLRQLVDGFSAEYAVRALADIGTPGTNALMDALKGTKDANTRRLIVEVFGRMEDKSVISVLVPLLNDNDPAVCFAVAESLDRLGWKPSTKAEIATFAVAKKQMAQAAAQGTVAIEPLLHRLQTGNTEDRVLAATMLGKFADPSAVQALIQGSKQLNCQHQCDYPSVSSAIDTALIDSGQAAVPALIHELGDAQS